MLEVRHLRVELPAADGGMVAVLRDVSFALGRSEILGLIGESGAGKSLTALSVLGLLPPGARVTGGFIRLEGIDLLNLGEPQMRVIRGGRIGYLPQEPATALNPMWDVGFHLREAIRLHDPGSRAAIRFRAEELLRLVGLDESRRIMRSFPQQLSSGQRQRVCLGVALAGRPDVLLADEPTSALDVRIQQEILATLARLRNELRLTVLLISHDLAAVAALCDRVLVMRRGEIVDPTSAAGLATATAVRLRPKGAA